MKPVARSALLLAFLSLAAVAADDYPSRPIRLIVPVGSSPEEFAEFLRVERSKWGKLIREAKLQLD